MTPQCGCALSMSGGLARQERRHSRTMGPIRFSDSSLLRPFFFHVYVGGLVGWWIEKGF